MNRLEANLKILQILTQVATAYPDLRFGQLLSNMGIATHNLQGEIHKGDIFFEESTETLQKLQGTNVEKQESSS